MSETLPPPSGKARHSGLEETLAALSDPELMQQIRQSEAAAVEGDVVALDDLPARLRGEPQA